MRSKSHADVWEWRELTWPDMTPPASALDALEHLGASPTLGPIVVETRASDAGIRWLLAARPERIDAATTLLETHLPVRVLTPRRVRKAAEYAAEIQVSGTDLSLDAARVLASVRGLYGALSRLQPGEGVVMQLVLGRRHTPPVRPNPAKHAWLTHVLRSPVMPPPPVTARKHRDGQHGASTVIRIGLSGVNAGRARTLLGDIVGALRVLESATTRIRTNTMSSPEQVNQARFPWRWPLALTSGELLGFTGWPIGEPPMPLLGGVHPRQLAPRVTLTDTDRVIGVASAPGHSERVGIPIRDAAFHTHVLGPTGSAKSTVMLSLISADIHAGRGVLLIDPKGDLAVDVLARIPKHRENDVVVIDPTNTSPIGFDPLAGNPGQGHVRADMLLGVFEALFHENWGIRTQDALTAALHTLTRIPGANLLWLPALFTNPAFRRKVLKQAGPDPLGADTFWVAYDAKKPEQQAVEIAPVLNKLRQLIMRPGLRAALGQRAPGFQMSDLFTHRRIVIVNLNRGVLGRDAARLLGTLLVGSLWTHLLARQTQPPERRHIVGIYIDEAHDFLAGLPTGDLSDALAQARSLGGAFTLANQYLAQFTPAMQKAVETNTRSKIYFALGGTDAAHIAKHTTGLHAQDLMLLPKYHAYVNVMQKGESTGWITVATVPPVPTISDPAAIYAHAHTLRGTPATDTERDLLNLIDSSRADAEATSNDGAEADEPIGRSRR